MRPIIVSEVARGYISLIAFTGELDALDQVVIEGGCLVSAVEMSRGKAVREAEKRLKGDLLTAAQHFRTALRLGPRMTRAHVNYGRLLERQGELDRAIRAWQTALQLDVEYDDAYYYLARAYRRRGEREREVSALEAFLALTPTGERADEVRERLRQLQSREAPE